MPAVNTKRETLADRKARMIAERQAEFAEEVAAWDKRLIALLIDYATLPGFSVSRTGDKHIQLIPNPDTLGWDEKYVLPIQFDPVVCSADVLHYRNEAQSAVIGYHAFVKEEERKRSVRIAAKAKLTEEEILLLGIR